MFSYPVYFEKNGQHVYLYWVYVCVKFGWKSGIGYRNFGKTS